MATEGPRQATVVTETSDGETPWTDPGNAITDNDSYATCTLGELARTDFLDFTDFDFATIDDADTVTNLQVEVAAIQSATGISWTYADIIKAGSPLGNPKSSGSSLGAVETYLSISNTMVNWGTTLTGAQVKASNFGMRVQFLNQEPMESTISVDACRITLTYTAAATGKPCSVMHYSRMRH